MKIFFIIFIFLFSPLLGVNNFLLAESQSVIISEIAWMGTENSANDEWLELKNLSSETISLDSWILTADDGSPEISLSGTIAPSGYFLLERTDDDSVPDAIADLIYTGALSNGGEILKLKNNSGEIIDSLNALSGWPGGDNDNKRTLERKIDLTWQTSAEVGGTPGAENSSGEISGTEESICGDGVLDADEECDDRNIADGDGCNALCLEEESDDGGENDEEIGAEEDSDGDSSNNSESGTGSVSADIPSYSNGDVLINEVCSDPSDEDVEWIELHIIYNDMIIDLSGWEIEEGSGAITKLEGLIGGSKRFLIIEKPKGNLNNAGDTIILRDGLGNIIDQVSYGNWDDGNLDNNAPAADDPYVIARKFDGQNTYNNYSDFVVTTTPTKGASNIITLLESQAEVSLEERSKYDYSDNILISEIFPNPKGADNEKEFIEIFNNSEESVNLLGWSFGDNSQRRYKIKEDKIVGAKEFFIFEREETGIALNNDIDSVKIFTPLEDDPLIEIKYEDVIEGWSFSLDFEKKDIYQDYSWTEIVTPGEKNIIKSINHPPEVIFYSPEEILVNTPMFFDASDTFDPDGDELSYEWDFGDGIKLSLPNPTHGFSETGVYEIKLQVSDGENEAEMVKVIRVVDMLGSNEIFTSLGEDSSKIVISEVLPNPTGSDLENEWIELFNFGNAQVNLLDWSVDDTKGGSAPYQFTSTEWLRPNEFYVLDRIESGLALNNYKESVRLFNNFGELVDEIEYLKSIEGESFARGQDGEFYWTSQITPGLANEISVADSEAYDYALTSAVSFSDLENVSGYKKISLNKIYEQEIGDLIITKGIVSVLPGVLGAQYFYIFDSGENNSSNSAGLQIYNYKKDFPKLAIGDYIEVTGELSQVNGEMRLKTKTQNDMIVLRKGEKLKPFKINCDQVSDIYLGQLISLSGQIVDRNGSTIYLDDGTDEARIYIKNTTGINPKNLDEGDNILISGILNKISSGLRLMPRSSEDIVQKDIESQGSVPQVLGEKIINNEWELAQRDKRIELFRYLLVVAIAVIFVLGVLLAREFRRK